MKFELVETSIDQIHEAYRSGELTCRQLVEMYLARINEFDQVGPELNAIITLNPDALVDADRLDAAQAAGGFVGRPGGHRFGLFEPALLVQQFGQRQPQQMRFGLGLQALLPHVDGLFWLGGHAEGFAQMKADPDL